MRRQQAAISYESGMAEAGTATAGTLVDTGPLFALVDPQGQPAIFARCQEALKTLAHPLVTTWPCLAEVMYLAGRENGWTMQSRIAHLITAGILRLHSPMQNEAATILALMEHYRNVPMDLTDASLVVLAENSRYTRIFTLDSDFYIYRMANGAVLEVVPPAMG